MINQFYSSELIKFNSTKLPITITYIVTVNFTSCLIPLSWINNFSYGLWQSF